MGRVAVVVVAVALVGGWATTASGSSGSAARHGRASGERVAARSAAARADEPLSAIRGVPQSGPRLGRANAPVAVTLWGDLECPLCRQFVLGHAFAQLVSHDVKSGRVEIRYQALRTASPTMSVFETQQVAALAAGRQDRFWQFAAQFLHDQGPEFTNYVNQRFLEKVARQVPGLNLAEWQRDRARPGLGRQIRREEAAAVRMGINATPTLVIRGSNGRSRTIFGVLTLRRIEATIESVS